MRFRSGRGRGALHLAAAAASPRRLRGVGRRGGEAPLMKTLISSTPTRTSSTTTPSTSSAPLAPVPPTRYRKIPTISSWNVTRCERERERERENVDVWGVLFFFISSNFFLANGLGGGVEHVEDFSLRLPMAISFFFYQFFFSFSVPLFPLAAEAEKVGQAGKGFLLLLLLFWESVEFRPFAGGSYCPRAYLTADGS